MPQPREYKYQVTFTVDAEVQGDWHEIDFDIEFIKAEIHEALAKRDFDLSNIDVDSEVI